VSSEHGGLEPAVRARAGRNDVGFTEPVIERDRARDQAHLRTFPALARAGFDDSRDLDPVGRRQAAGE